MSELQDKRHAEEGYRTVGLAEVKKREWFSTAEKDDPAAKWLGEFDPSPSKGHPPQTCIRPGCGTSFIPKHLPRRFCSRRCQGWGQRNGRTPEQRARIRERQRLYMRGWVKDKKVQSSIVASRKKSLRKLREANRAKAAEAVYTCIDCSLVFGWKNGRIIAPAPKRCAWCSKNWRRYIKARGARRSAVGYASANSSPMEFKVGDLVTWSPTCARLSISHAGVVVGVVPAGINPGGAVAELTSKLKVPRRNVMFGSWAGGIRALGRLSYLVESDGRIYRPLVGDLRLAPAPAANVAPIRSERPARERQLNAAGTVLVRKRMAA